MEGWDGMDTCVVWMKDLLKDGVMLRRGERNVWTREVLLDAVPVDAGVRRCYAMALVFCLITSGSGKEDKTIYNSVGQRVGFRILGVGRVFLGGLAFFDLILCSSRSNFGACRLGVMMKW